MGMDWKVKAAVFRVLSVLPFGSAVLLQLQKNVTLTAVLNTSRGLLAPGGVAIQAIDYSDHYARSHVGLSRFNFLTFSAKAWRKYNPGLHYVNRLRHSEFVRLFRGAGYAIALDEPTVSAHDPDILQRRSSEFTSFDHDDLFTLRSWIVATSAARQPSPTPVPA